MLNGTWLENKLIKELLLSKEQESSITIATVKKPSAYEEKNIDTISQAEMYNEKKHINNSINMIGSKSYLTKNQLN